MMSYRASGLMLITAAITLWNTVNIENAINQLKKKGLPFNDQLLSHLSTLSWKHINLTGDYIWRTNKKLAERKYRPLRSVDISEYKNNFELKFCREIFIHDITCFVGEVGILPPIKLLVEMRHYNQPLSLNLRHHLFFIPK